jgi:Na+-driven multidrug efflux pump
VKVGILFDFAYGVLAGLLLFFVLRPYWGPIFSTDPEVQQLGEY